MALIKPVSPLGNAALLALLALLSHWLFDVKKKHLCLFVFVCRQTTKVNFLCLMVEVERGENQKVRMG